MSRPIGWRKYPAKEGYRICTKCKRELPETAENFYFRADRNRYEELCYPCKNEVARLSRKDNEAFQLYVQWRKAGCYICGQPHWEFVDAHHIDETTKLKNPSLIRDLDEMISELSKCVPVCSNCHLALLMEEFRRMPFEEAVIKIRAKFYSQKIIERR